MVPFFLALKLLSSGSLPPGVEPWKLNTMGPVDEIIVDNLSISNIAPGTYYLYLMATPANSLQHYYIWNTEFTTGVSGAVLDVAMLYSQSCSSCHGTLANSTKTGRTASQIQSAINSNTGGMGSINLTSAQVQAIGDVLAQQTPIPPAVSHPENRYKDHRSYVKQNGTLECTSCHGADLRGGSGPSCYSCHGKKW
jgi:mono/diheme cytochrome c family protein